MILIQETHRNTRSTNKPPYSPSPLARRLAKRLDFPLHLITPDPGLPMHATHDHPADGDWHPL